MSLSAEDLKKLIERPDLEYRAGMAVCASAETFVEDALAASRRAVGPIGTHRLRALYFFVVLGCSLVETLPISFFQEATQAVSALLPAEGDFFSHVLVDEPIDGALIIVIAGAAGKP